MSGFSFSRILFSLSLKNSVDGKEVFFIKLANDANVKYNSMLNNRTRAEKY